VSTILRVVEGNIASFQGEAVVNAANNHLWMGGGVAGALLDAGGGAIQEECDEYLRREGPLRVGEAALTGAGRLPARFVIHAAAMGDEPASEQSIREATRNSLRLALENGVASLAFPILGSGIAGFPFDEAARIMVEEVREVTSEASCLELVALYAYTSDQAEALQRILT
jgi:O-acetyl-ADP-ribose deacetylase (regulator of RNase III)